MPSPRSLLFFILGLGLLLVLLRLNSDRTGPVNDPAPSGRAAGEAAAAKAAAETLESRSDLKREGSPPGAESDSQRSGEFIPDVVFAVEVRAAESDLPLEGAQVSVTSLLGIRAAQGETDAQGRFKALIPGLEYRVSAAYAGRVTEQVTVVSGPAPSVTLRLIPAQTLRGRVADGKGRGLEGVQVSLLPDEPSGLRPVAVITNARGRFELEAGAGRYRLQTARTGYRQSSRRLQLPSGEFLEIRIQAEEPLVRLRGAVLNDRDQPVSLATVEIRTARPANPWKRTLRTDQTGRFDIEWPPGPSQVSVRALGFRELEETVEAGSPEAHLFRLQKLPLFQIEVLDPLGRPVSNPRIAGFSPQGQSVLVRSAAGYFSRQYPFRVYAHAFGLGLGLSRIEEYEQAPPVVYLHFPPDTALQGTVTDPGGRPIQEFALKIETAETLNFPARETLQDPQGKFHLRGLPVGQVWISVAADGHGPYDTRLTIRPGVTAVLQAVLPALGR